MRNNFLVFGNPQIEEDEIKDEDDLQEEDDVEEEEDIEEDDDVELEDIDISSKISFRVRERSRPRT